ncbi:hypothetical protein K2F43_06150 [Clostridium estertheticum]|uniref:hypothetical protein n=1 Tax=Clostridium estertheticum TaxID=238834 RepID=UPI001C6E21F4|nr:hypothetical protein [Clostridium estertheticum]MBW9170788.1 hypothetical protein [Clostridium estertheticum]WLC74373.1 hypothetical protein KTC99_16605 [Clostridium estertheticum]
MSKATANLGLFKYENTDADNISTFNIDIALNENWDKIDVKTKEIDDKVVTTINGKTGNEITLSASDVGAGTIAQGKKADTALQDVQLGANGGVAKQDDLITLQNLVTSESANNSKQVPHLGTTTNSSDAYNITTTETILTNQKFTITFNANSITTPTLKINNGIAYAIKKANGNSAKLYASTYTLFWNGTSFIQLGEGGDYGTAIATDVRNTKTVGTENGVVSGTLDLSNLLSDNIRSGVIIGGIVGTVGLVASDNVIFTEGVTQASTKIPTRHSARFSTNLSGSIRIKYNVQSPNAVNYTGFSQVYKNESPIGTLHQTPSTNFTTFTQDFICNIGDYFEVYLWVGTDTQVNSEYLKICFNDIYTNVI